MNGAKAVTSNRIWNSASTMYEAIREVFGEGSSTASWPENLSPRDVGIGPYDFPRAPQKTAWNFDADMEGWAAMMNVSTPVVAEGIMHFKTTSSDPALVHLNAGTTGFQVRTNYLSG